MVQRLRDYKSPISEEQSHEDSKHKDALMSLFPLHSEELSEFFVLTLFSLIITLIRKYMLVTLPLF